MKNIQKALALSAVLGLLAYACSSPVPRYARPSPPAGPGAATGESGNQGAYPAPAPAPIAQAPVTAPEISPIVEPAPAPTDTPVVEQSPGPKPMPSPGPIVDPNAPLKVEVKGRQLIVNGKAFFMRSIAWNPVKKGKSHPEGLIYKNPTDQDLKDIDKDLRLIKEMGGNTIRTYDVVRDAKVLDLIKKHGLYVIVPALNYFGTNADAIKGTVDALKNHPTTLLWELGNEWNYNALYGNAGGANGAKGQIMAGAKQIKGLDKTHPTATVYGEVPSQALINEMGDIDVWGINVYSGLTFGDRFQKWKGLSGKPLYVGEYGADAVNKTQVDVGSQAKAVATLSKEIMENLSSKNGENALIGGSLFEFSDEWWKDGAGSANAQEIGGIAPGGGPFPDAVFNEEWWGVVDIDRNPRPAYNDLKALWAPVKD